MKFYLAVVLLCLLGCDQVLGRKLRRHRCLTDVSRKQCPLLEVGSNTVITERFMSQIATGHWLDIYSIRIGNPPLAGKSDTRWRQSGSTVTRDISFLGSGNTCINVSINLMSTETKCGVQLNQVGGDRIERFYSQDLAKYFWWLICLEPTNNGEGCNQGYFDLQIRDTRAVMNIGEINLAGLPWGKIAADLRHIRKVGFGDINGPDYIWIGKECPLP